MSCRLCFIPREELGSILSAAVHWSLNYFGSFIISLSTEVNIILFQTFVSAVIAPLTC